MSTRELRPVARRHRRAASRVLGPGDELEPTTLIAFRPRLFVDHTCRPQRRSIYPYLADRSPQMPRGKPSLARIIGRSASGHAEVAMSSDISGSLQSETMTIL